MSPLTRILFVVGLGAFWGASPMLNKALGLAGIPVAQIVMASGFGVGFGLIVLTWLWGGSLRPNRPVLLFGLGCGVLLNVPWAISLTAIRHVPVALSAVIISSTPLWTYGVALLLGREHFSVLRLAALFIGLASSAVVILTRPDASVSGEWVWILLTLSLPLLYAFYNVFAAAAWPRGMEPMMAGIGESFFSGLIALPFMIVLQPVTATAVTDHLLGYGLLGATLLMWVIERVCFFSLIRATGPVTTVFATYVSTPAAIGFGMLAFGERLDGWLLLCLALLMVSLWLDNRARRSDAHQPEHQSLQKQHAEPVAAIDDRQ